MEGSQLQALLDRLETDEDLRVKFLEAERSAKGEALKINKQIGELRDANVATLTKIAEEAGYDISDAIKRPSDFQPTPTEQEFENLAWPCIFTCCFLATSQWEPPIPQGPYWTTDFCPGT